MLIALFDAVPWPVLGLFVPFVRFVLPCLLVTTGGETFPGPAAGGGQVVPGAEVEGCSPGSIPVGSRSARSTVIAASKSSSESNAW